METMSLSLARERRRPVTYSKKQILQGLIGHIWEPEESLRAGHMALDPGT
jgi:hypothetical protein